MTEIFGRRRVPKIADGLSRFIYYELWVGRWIPDDGPALPIRLLTAVHAGLAALAFARRATLLRKQSTMRSLVLEIGFSCMQFLNVPGVSDYVGSQLGLAIAPSPV